MLYGDGDETTTKVNSVTRQKRKKKGIDMIS